MKLKAKVFTATAGILAIMGLHVLAEARKLDLLLSWRTPPGYDTNGGIFNIRYLGEGDVTADYLTWHLLATVSNVSSHQLYGVWETTLFSVSHTNEQTGVESNTNIAPVYATYVFRTNTVPVPEPTEPPPPYVSDLPPDAKDFPDRLPPEPTPRAETNAPPQSLQISWNGPPNWQANGGIFNIRAATNGSVANNPLTWALTARVTNILNVKFFNVNPTQWYAISFTNAALGSESTEGIPPVQAQYNWQGVKATTMDAKRFIEGLDFTEE